MVEQITVTLFRNRPSFHSKTRIYKLFRWGKKKVWPASFEGYTVVAAALGGAHTIVLVEKRTHPGLVNPWGRHRQCYAFGYGFNGQLGTDNFVDEFLPVPVKLPRWELVAQV